MNEQVCNGLVGYAHFLHFFFILFSVRFFSFMFWSHRVAYFALSSQRFIQAYSINFKPMPSDAHNCCVCDTHGSWFYFFLLGIGTTLDPNALAIFCLFKFIFMAFFLLALYSLCVCVLVRFSIMEEGHD